MDWHNTHAKSNGFTANVTTFAIAHTWFLGTLCYKATDFACIIENNGILKQKYLFKHNDLANKSSLHKSF
jgi:hypothetical protein